MSTNQKQNLYTKQMRNFWFSAGLALLFSVSLVMPALAGSASLFLSPSSGTYNVGSTFSVAVKVNSGGVAINAAEATINFNRTLLSVVRLSKSGSIFTLWTEEPTFSNSAGNIIFGGGSPKAFSGTSGTIFTITFKAKAAGSASVSFVSGLVLAADGRGTNVLGKMDGGTYTLRVEVTEEEEEYIPPAVPGAPVVSSPTHPDEEKWYSNNNPEFTWSLPKDITKVSYSIDKKPFTNPKFVAEKLESEARFLNLEDGIWYFHINFKNQAGWGALTHRKVLIDTQPPNPFEIEVNNGGDPTNPTPLLIFTSEDPLSGIEYYEVKIEGERPATMKEDRYRLPLQAPGERVVVVKAFDKAGNFTSASTNISIEPLEPPIITEIPETLKEGESLVVKGTSLYPKATIKIYIQKGTDRPVEKETKTNQDGDWTYVHDIPVEEGTYKIWAKVIDSRGAQSLPSEKITLTIIPRSLSEIFKGSALIVILLLIIIGILISFIFHQRQEMLAKKKWLKRETKEVRKRVSSVFQALRKEVKGLVFRKEAQNRLREALNISEKFIKKEIEDVEKALE